MLTPPRAARRAGRAPPSRSLPAPLLLSLRYASFFFRLQTLCQQQAPSGYRQPLNLEAARSIEARVRTRPPQPPAARAPRGPAPAAPRARAPAHARFRTPCCRPARRARQVSQRQAELHEARKTRSDTHPILLGRRPAVMN